MTDTASANPDLNLTENMEEQPAASDVIPEGAYHFRVSGVEKKDGEGSNGSYRLVFGLKVQTEGEAFGRTTFFGIDMGDSRGRANLKSLYNACGYRPVGFGHNPASVIDGEFLATVKHKVYQGVTYANVQGWTIKPLVG